MSDASLTRASASAVATAVSTASASARVPCPACEIRELQTRATKESIQNAVDKMEYVEGITTPKEEYHRRLLICSGCSNLLDGIQCTFCNSYVAYRAKILRSTCPYPGKNKWA